MLVPQLKVTINGTVQGVGFRPFIYRTAKKNNIQGYIKNSGNSVELLLQGKDAEITEFLNSVKNNSPPLSRITKIDMEPCNDNKYDDFLILKSEKHGESDSVMPPDVAICDSCLSEVFDIKNRRYLYPFTVCTDCGPRFTIIESLPYDRENTTMSNFHMCDTCKQEYFDATDRRFRAEPVCCPDCGPLYELYRGKENTHSKNPIKDAAVALDSGKIVAIKGIGGTHLCAQTTDDDAIIRIRKILNRPYKAFAIMARNIIEARNIVSISEKEELLLSSYQRPVVILKKKNKLSKYISPGLNSIGIMLPYSGMHHLLFYYSKQPAFVMTSANSPGEPMAIDNADILSVNAEFSLIHNRKIKNRCDDSVIKVANNNVSFIRRSRGFVPSPIEVKDTKRTVLSLGAELDVTACILKKDKAFLTQYIGNTTKLRTLEYLESAVYNLMELIRADKIEAIAVDMHPSFNTSSLGLELSKKLEVPLIKCQHHFAHAASLLAESGLERMVCITADGVGYGNDGTIWGGEIISVDDGFERIGSLMPQLMPGGDLAARYPARMVASILSKKFDREKLCEIFSPYFESDELAVILKQIERGFNSPLTTSTGRILDSIAALLGVCTERTYEGEPAMKLEAFAMKGRDTVDIPVLIKKIDGRYMLDTTEIIKEVYLKKNDHSLHDIAASAQNAIARGLCRIAIKSAQDKNIDVIGFSGGVAYNDAIISTVRNIAEEQDFNFITHTKVPCGDGGICLGQTMIGASELE
ncbi:MAG: carbamoyltransferase HypF [Candidatus Methanoperedens sp.]